MISIIIPIYNVEMYIKECIDSVLMQTYQNFEILLIDDGSTDSSGKLCDEIALTDFRIKVFHKSNGGSASARNYGMEKAVGEYIIFLDSDDYWIEKNILSLLVEKAKSDNLDVVRGEYINVDERGNRLYTPNLLAESLNFRDLVFGSFEMVKYIVNGNFFSWLFMFRRSALDHLRFDENRKFQEDIDFAVKIFSRNLRCGYLPIQFYAYRKRENSIMATPCISNLENSFTLCDVFYEYAYKVEDKRLFAYYLYWAIMMYYWTLEAIASDLYINQYKEIEKILALKAIRYKVYKWTKEISMVHFPIHLYVSPCIGICLFRLRWWVGRILRILKFK
ncbi:glycosyltransferase family 2 protein [Phocaeicola plebeius]|jgi:glycosyltransferase involved in cell wall biosynthesis|uniref:glycosyltransferase family 2 protein n=1 Tax=Phocaeicola plebeius TaxID=310297 RepID=UPI0026EE679F|nr:glycosyltransferase family 2 protein [Phocaeicola plebeius]